LDPKTCNFVLSWDYDGLTINYELIALSNTWAGIVFSDDQKLGNDNIVVCMKEPDSDTISIVNYYKNTSDSELLKLDDNNILKKQGIYSPEGFIYCKFSREKSSSNPLVTDLNKPHYIYVERGSPGK
jgi:hypothetical protein